MVRGSKVFRSTDVPESNASSYPESFREGQRKRHNRRLSDHAGLKNYGVNLVRVQPVDSRRRVTRIRSRMNSFTCSRANSCS
jgi:hypothetical protein